MAALTLKALYQHVTGDTTSHQRAVDARFRKLDTHRQKMVRARLEGRTLRDIGAAAGISVGTVQSHIEAALEKIRKDIAGEPRYNRVGRTKRKDASSATTAVAMGPAPDNAQRAPAPRRHPRSPRTSTQ